MHASKFANFNKILYFIIIKVYNNDLIIIQIRDS